MIEAELLEAFRDLLVTRGMSLDVEGLSEDAGIPAVIHTPRSSLQVSILSPAEAEQRNRRSRNIPLVLAPVIRPAHAESLRRGGVNFADLKGTMFISAPGFYVDIRGQRPEIDFSHLVGEKRNMLRSPLDLFTPARAQVVFALITWPDLIGEGIREIARASGASIGAAQGVVESVRKEHPRFDKGDRAKLYLDWLSAYPRRLLPKLIVAEVHTQNPRSIVGPDIWLSGESALPELIRPATITVYVDELRPSLLNANRWKKADNPNVSVRRKFWTAPIDWSIAEDGQEVAPATLVYADLLANGDARMKEVASDFAGTNAQLRELTAR
ncbi:type IV toxin-antitoxin system AbiEi family antitoxin [Paenarthrobacter sp. NPDC018779]|uniref:type IV toxin-antitoxin system AbiEi family antitoxin n=1 Tax=Paenarthrobacter sp. NPDC018779 TaxID=3364375 RepID=UPI0037C864E4